jgi:hypothetical protein
MRVANICGHLRGRTGCSPAPAAATSAEATSTKVNVLIIGGRGTIGAGLRTYLPKLDARYHITALDLPDSDDKAKLNADYTAEVAAHTEFLEADFMADPGALKAAMSGVDLVVFLARGLTLPAHKKMADLVFDTLLALPAQPMIVAASSVHATDGLCAY